MMYKYSPVITLEETFENFGYTIGADTVTATYEGEEDVFDFSGFPDGHLAKVETTLSNNPIVDAYRENGTLYVVLKRYIRPDAPEAERFPEWEEVNS